MGTKRRRLASALGACAIAVAQAVQPARAETAADERIATPIKHVVVIFLSITILPPTPWPKIPAANRRSLPLQIPRLEMG
jgi:hypothetical protein